MNSYFEDEDSKEVESYDFKRMLKIFGIVFVIAAVIFTAVIFFTRTPNQSYEGDFDLTSSDKAELSARAESVLATAGNYGVLSEITKDNFLEVQQVIYNKYYLDTSDPALLTRKAAYEQSLGYMYSDSKIKSSYDKLNSDEMGMFLSRYSIDNIEVKLPDEGYVDSDGVNSVIITASFTSNKVLNLAKDDNVDWNGDVEVREKTDEEEVELTFKQDEDGIWGLDFITRIKDPNSLALVSPRAIEPEDYKVTSTYNVGVTREEDLHSSENTDPDDFEGEEPPGSFDSFEEDENGTLILPETPPQS